MSTDVLMSVDNNLAPFDISSTASWVIHDGGSSSWKKKKINSDLKPVMSSAKPHAVCKTVQLFLYVQNITTMINSAF
jgi:hypothetical protein